MPHFICRWPGGDVLLASVESRQELDAILQERCEPGVCKVARYHGPLVLELKPDVPGVPRSSAERFTPGPACPAYEPAWSTRASSGDVNLLAGDGSSQRVHKLVLHCRLPVLHGQPVAAHVSQVRLRCVPDGECLLSLVHFLYLDDVQHQEQLTPQLHRAAIACGLQRLVSLCEAQFAQQLELQLVSVPGLSESRRAAVLDSFVGWATYAEQLGRQELRQLCLHAIARHLSAAQSRPSWSSLSASSASIARLIAASTAPPLVHRQVSSEGSAVLAVPSNPPPSVAITTGPVVSVDAEALAAAGGKLTSAEWMQLHNFRSAVADSIKSMDACPIAIDQQQLNRNQLVASNNPHIAFTVKQPALGPHKRLMDSVLRFAFPATHALLGSGWQLSPAVANTNSTSTGPGSGAGTPLAATAATPIAAGAGRTGPFAAHQQVGVASLLGRPLTPSTAQGVPAAASPAGVAALLPISTSQGTEGSNSWSCQSMPLPVPGPAATAPPPLHQPQQPVPHRLAAANRGREASPGAPTSSEDPASTPMAADLFEPRSVRSSHAGTMTGQRRSIGTRGSTGDSAPGSPDAPSAAGRHLRRMLSGGGASSRSSSHAGRTRSDSRPSWGVAATAAPAADLQQQGSQHHQQQQQIISGALSQGAALPLHMQRLLHDRGELSWSWGSGPVTRQDSLQSTQQMLNDAEHQPEQQAGQQQVVHPSHLSIRTSQRPADAGQISQHQQQSGPVWVQRESDFSNNVEATLGRFESAADRAEQAEQQVEVHHHCILDLPTSADLAVGPGGSQQPAMRDNSAAAGAAGIGFPATPSPATNHRGSNKACSLSALQRALVEDFILYEEASAARQHVVGILVAIEQGDEAAGQRLLSPACAELIAATAPAPAANKIAGLASASTLGSAGVNEIAAVQAAREYLRSAKGMGKLLGMASSSRSALEPSPAQQQQQQQQLVRALHRLAAQLPGLARLLATHPVAAATMSAAGAGGSSAVPQQPGTVAVGKTEESNMLGSGQYDLNAAVADLLQLPELLQGLQLSKLLTEEQFNQRQQQLQQLASHAAAMLTQQAAEAAPSPEAAVLAAQAHLTALGSLVPASGSTRPAGVATVSTAAVHQQRERGFQAGMLFSSILASLSAAGPTPTPSISRLGPGSSQYSSAGIVAGGALTGSGSTNAAYPGYRHTGGAGAGLYAGTGIAGGAAGAGVFAPTGVGALLAGGLLAEGGVAGDSILEDMAADVLLGQASRRITCNGLYELCATLATAATSPPREQVSEHADQHLEPQSGTIANVASLSGTKRRLSSEEEQQPAAKR